MVVRTFLIVDGSNLYHRLRELKVTELLAFDYTGLSKFVTGKREVVARKYYVGAIREERGNHKSRKLMANQQKLLGRLQKEGWEIGFGHMLKTDRYREKGVDVLMAVDILVGGYEDKYDTVAVLSSDTDLIPALVKVREQGKKVEYVGFSHQPSYGLIKHSDIRRLLTLEDVQEFALAAGTGGQEDRAGELRDNKEELREIKGN